LGHVAVVTSGNATQHSVHIYLSNKFSKEACEVLRVGDGLSVGPEALSLPRAPPRVRLAEMWRWFRKNFTSSERVLRFLVFFLVGKGKGKIGKILPLRRFFIGQIRSISSFTRRFVGCLQAKRVQKGVDAGSSPTRRTLGPGMFKVDFHNPPGHHSENLTR